MSATASSALLAAACGFGAAVWLLSVRRAGRWQAGLYILVAAAYVAIGVLLTARIIGRPVTPTPFISAFLLTVVFVVPPAIQLAAHLKARRLIEEQRNGHE